MNLAAHFRKADCLWLLLAALAISPFARAATWKEQVLYSFQGGTNDGFWPAGGVVSDKQGNLYGATTGGGPGNCFPISEECGLVFQLAPPAKKGDPWTETILYQFQGKGSNDGSVPAGGVILDSAGNLYGTTAYGGTGDCNIGVSAGCGTVYELSPPAKKGGPWTETILYSFKSGKDGYFPWGNLTFDGKGSLYGATQFGGGKGNTCNPYYQYCGTVFELSPPKQKGGNWNEKVLYSFGGVANGKQSGDGANPNGGLVLDRKGAIYGTTHIGGFNCPHNSNQGCGTVFKLTPPKKKAGAWKEEVVYSFKYLPDGDRPFAGVILDSKGNLLGTTPRGGSGNSPSGTVFQLSHHSNGAWTEETLYDFQGNADGGQPEAGLVFGAKGAMYGTASTGGNAGAGTIFRLHRAPGGSWAFETIYEFAGSPDGSYPAGVAVFDESGNLYSTSMYSGTGQACGNYGCGTVFEARP